LYDEARQRLYLSDIDHVDVFEIMSSSFDQPGIEPPGGPPPTAGMRGLALIPDGSQLVAADFGSQTIYLFNPDTRSGTTVPVGGVAGSMVHLSAEMCRGLPKLPCMFNSSELLFTIVNRILAWNVRQPLNPSKKHLIAILREEIRQPDQRPLRLTIPREERLARVAAALLDDVGDDRTLEDWAHVAGMARRTFMRAFSAQVGMSFGRWRQQARLFAALEMLAQRKSVTEVAIAVGYDSVSAFIEMFRTMLGTTPQRYFRSRQEPGLK